MMPQRSANWSFDEAYWAQAIKKPDWYLEFVPYARKMADSLDKKQLDDFRKTSRHFFETALRDGEIALADNGPNLDAERKTIDTIVVHHTSAKPGYRLGHMEATQLLNIYAAYYTDPALARERKLKGPALWSGHFRDGHQTFLCYHWLMRLDGTFERLLDDDKIGWHAGNWDINKRSVAICLDNDYENQDPTDEILQKLAAHIRQNYPDVKTSNIIGHCEAHAGTICPGTNFLSGWKAKLLEKLA